MAGTLVIRADASPTIGSGHVIRSLALAQAWQAAGGRAILVGHCPLEWLRRRIRATDVTFEPMDRPHPDPADIPATRASLARIARESNSLETLWLALDGYHFDPAYQDAVRPAEGRLLLVDDSPCWPEYHVDVLLNQNLGAELATYPGEEHTTYLLGPRYALLRPEFRAQEKWQRPPAEEQDGRPARILVMLGGADPNNITETVLRALAQLDLPAWEARVLAPVPSTHAKPPKAPPLKPGAKLQILGDTPQMAELMQWADVALSAAGSTCWEMAAMQLPAVVMMVAENQRAVAEPLSAAGVLVNLGPVAGIDPGRIAGELSALARDPARRTAMAQAARRLIDPRGVGRVVSIMDALDEPLPEKDTILRPVTADDLLPLWRLANDPTIRRWSLTPDAIPLDEHTRWFEERLLCPDTAAWVLDFHGLILAPIRYHRVGAETAEVSLSVAPAFRRRGVGSKLLQRTLRSGCQKLGVKRLRAVVREENIPSIRIFHKAGFEQTDTRRVEGFACRIFEREVE